MCSSRTEAFRTIIAEHSGNVNKRHSRQTSPWQKEASALAQAVLELNDLLASVGQEYINPTSRKLSEADKDGLDSQVTSLLRKALDRLGALEAAHERDTASLNNKPSSSLAETLLSSWLPPNPAVAAARHRASHRQQILVTLSARLETCSRSHANIHDLRTKLKLKRADPYRTATARKNDTKYTSMSSAPAPDLSQPDIDEILSPEQLQQFQSESDALFRSAQQDLEQVQQVESKIQDIAELHSALLQNLTTQSAHTNQLYDDALYATEKLHAGNIQLKEARDRNRESRFMLLAFLIGASLTLLFIELY